MCCSSVPSSIQPGFSLRFNDLHHRLNPERAISLPTADIAVLYAKQDAAVALFNRLECRRLELEYCPPYRELELHRLELRLPPSPCPNCNPYALAGPTTRVLSPDVRPSPASLPSRCQAMFALHRLERCHLPVAPDDSVRFCEQHVEAHYDALSAQRRIQSASRALEGRHREEDAARAPQAAVRALKSYVVCLECEAWEYARHKQQFGCEGA